MATYVIKSRLTKKRLASALGVKGGLQTTFTNKAGGEERFILKVGRITAKPGDATVCYAEAEVESAELIGTVKIPFTKRVIPLISAWVPNPIHPKRVSLEISDKGDNYIHM